MNALAWKEWRENRIIIALAVLIVAVCPLFSVIGVVTNISSPMAVNLVLWITVVAWCLCALYCGSSMVAPEVGNGSLQLLSSLPLSRKQIWLTKVGMGLVITLAGIAASTIVMALVTWIGIDLHVITQDNVPQFDRFDGLSSGLLVVSGFFLFAVGSVATMMFDRAISALMASALISMILYAMTSWSVEQALWLLTPHKTPYIAPPYENAVMIAAFALMTVNLLAASYNLFIEGETLKTNKRYMILLRYSIAPVVVFLAVLIGSWMVKI